MSAEDKSDRFEGVAPADIVDRHLLDSMRVLHLAGDVDIESVTALTRKMLFLEDMDPHSDITLRINSYGGSAEATFGLVDVMRCLKCDVRTVAEGSAMSAGALILAAGTRGKRFVGRHSSVMLHRLQTCGAGHNVPILDAERDREHALRLDGILVDMMAKFTRRSKSKISKDMERDLYLIGAEVVQYGVADAVL